MDEMQRLALCAAVQLFTAGYDAIQRARAMHLGRQNSMPALSTGRVRKIQKSQHSPLWHLDESTALPTLINREAVTRTHVHKLMIAGGGKKRPGLNTRTTSKK